VYDAAWDGQPSEVFTTRAGSTESRPLGLPDAQILSVSSSGEMAILLHPRPIGAGLWVRAGTLAQVPLAGGQPRPLADGVQQADWAPDGQLLIVREVEGRSRIEWPIGKAVVEGPGWFGHPRIAPDGERVAYLDHPVRGDDGGTVRVWSRDGRGGAIGPAWASVQGLAWGRDGELWFSAYSGVGRELFAARLGQGGAPRLLARAPATLTLHDRAPDGRALVAADTLRSGVEVLAPGAAEERDLSWLDWSVAMDLSDDGTQILLDEEGQGGGPKYAAYLRRTDGSPPVRLCSGRATALSPDGQWVLAVAADAQPAQVTLVPTGAGQPRPLTSGTRHHIWARWFPDGKRVLLAANDPGRATRLWVQPAFDGGAARPITPEWMDSLAAVSPDGALVAAVGADRRVTLYPVDGGAPRPVPLLAPGELPLRFSSDGASLFVFRGGEVPAKIERIELASGRREAVREVAPADRAGLASISRILLARDAAAYAYRYYRQLSDLYLVTGME
jgi:hypothetical protein